MKEPSPGAQRQQFYRSQHPQLNITFQSREEEAMVLEVCWRQHQTPREVLVAWAEKMSAESSKR